MDKAQLFKYAPWLIVAFGFFMSYNLFVTPVQLEKVHREILIEISQRYTTKEMTDMQKAQLDDMQNKIDKIYDKIMSK